MSYKTNLISHVSVPK